MTPALSGLLETSLYVDDVGRAAEFYRSLFGFEILVQDERFCGMSVAGKQVLLLFQKGSATSVTNAPPAKAQQASTQRSADCFMDRGSTARK